MDKNKKIISVIIPVYKVAKYLNKCIDSIVNQAYNNLEIILVDDGSPDECPMMCDEWTKKDKRIKVVHKENGGVCSARNEGIRQSSGSFITFVDGDDYVDENFSKAIELALKNEGSDIISFGFEKDGKICGCHKNIILNPSENDDLEQYCLLDVTISCCFKFINRNFLIKENLFFGEGRRSEDFEWSFRSILKSKQILLSDIAYYHYVTNDNSETHFITVDAVLDHYKNTKKVFNYINEKSLRNRKKIYSIVFQNNIYYLIIASKLKKSDKKLFINFYKKNKNLFIKPKNFKLKLIYFMLKLIGINGTLWFLKVLN